MIKYALVLALFAGACSQPIPPEDCKRFMTGTFVFEGTSGAGFKIVRTADKQTETNLSTGETSKWSVSWTDDCTYVITFRERSSSRPTLHNQITVKFVKAVGDLLYFDTYADGQNLLSGKMQKVK